MKYTILMLLAGFLSSCSGNKNVSENDLDRTKQEEAFTNPFVTFSNAEVTAQYQMPGIESNLKSTCQYDVLLSATFTKKAQIVNILVDTISIPVNYFTIDGENSKNTDFFFDGAYEKINFKVSRQIYRTNYTNGRGNNFEINYASSGKIVPEGKIEIEVISDGQSIFYVSDVVKKENLYRP